MAFATKRISEVPDVIARDGSEVRVLCALSRGGMATFTLLPGTVSKAVAHRTIEEVWYFIRGHGRLWRKSADAEEITEIGVGLSISIPTGDIPTLDFALTEAQKKELYDSGYKTAKAFFDAKPDGRNTYGKVPPTS